MDRRHDERLVVADATLRGERVISIIRIALFALLGLASAIAARLEPSALVEHPWRVWVIAVYGVFCFANLGTMFLLKRGSPRAAQYWPFFHTTMDFTFMWLMGFTRWQSGAGFVPEQNAVTSVLLICFNLTRFSGAHAFFATLVACGSYVTLTLATHTVRPGMQWFILVVFMMTGFLIGWANGRIRKMFVEIRQRENLSRFLPRQVADRVMRNVSMLKPAQREVTILFSDIRDFTAMSERMQPDELLRFLDRFFGHMGQIVKAHDGVVNKFLGDGMLAVWGVPDKDEQHPEKALKAALDMRRKLAELNQERAQEGLPAIRMGIGIHTGMVAAGMLGGADQHEYTVIGDAVNLASRIEGLTKSLGVDLLVSDSTWSKLQAKFEGVRAGEQKVKGREKPVVVYTVAKAS